jgi:hypothetical protein
VSKFLGTKLKDYKMLKMIIGAIGTTFAGAAAWAGGLSDAIVETVPDEVMPMAAEGSGTGWIIPAIIVGLLIAVAVSGDDGDGDDTSDPGS